jgi:hypothetical protein
MFYRARRSVFRSVFSRQIQRCVWALAENRKAISPSQKSWDERRCKFQARHSTRQNSAVPLNSQGFCDGSFRNTVKTS